MLNVVIGSCANKGANNVGNAVGLFALPLLARIIRSAFFDTDRAIGTGHLKSSASPISVILCPVSDVGFLREFNDFSLDNV
mgnify:CR=1 FL=1